MPNKTTKAVQLTSGSLSSRLFVAPRLSRVLRNKFLGISQLKLLGAPRNLIKIVLVGTTFVAVTFFLLLCFSYFVGGNTYVLPRMIACIPIFLYLFSIMYFVTKNQLVFAAWLLIGFYTLLGATILWFWSINAQAGILSLLFVIILAGTILGARYIMPTTVGVVCLLAALQLGHNLQLIHPDIASIYKQSTFADVIIYGIIFTVFALLSWLSRRQIEQALERALTAEAALKKEKRMLATRLEEKTRHLREVQLEEMQQLYRFAELGQLSTALLHELANQLTVLTLDIDDIGQRHHQSEAVAHAKESISHLDSMVTQVRRQLRENNEFEEFSIVNVINETLETLQPKAAKAHVSIVTSRHTRSSDLHAFGDPLRLSQIITVLVTNAIDSYSALEESQQPGIIEIDIRADSSTITLSVADHAGGISEFQRSQLFMPFKSTKDTGMGIGLFIAKQMAETHFKGSLSLDERTDQTRFIIQLPAYRARK